MEKANNFRKCKRHEHTFIDLIKALDEVDGISRLRISSIEPNLLNDDIIEFVTNSKKFVSHFHIPLQSGSDKILKLMKRRYLTDLYKSRVNKIKDLMPHCCIGVDVIVGFPGETENDFKDTFNFLENLDISYLHVFSYSDRDNTESNSFIDKLPGKIKSKRSKILRDLSLKKKKIFYKKNMNTVRPVLFESKNHDGYIFGYTDNYIRVKSVWSNELVDKIIDCKLIKIDDDLVVRAKTNTNVPKALHL